MDFAEKVQFTIEGDDGRPVAMEADLWDSFENIAKIIGSSDIPSALANFILDRRTRRIASEIDVIAKRANPLAYLTGESITGGN